jgi:hypothetical protein
MDEGSMKVYKVTLHFKTGTKQTLTVKSIQITETSHGLERVNLTYFDEQAGRFDVKDILAIFLEKVKQKQKLPSSFKEHRQHTGDTRDY